MIKKTPNQLWKESGTTLSFKEWITREKQKHGEHFNDIGAQVKDALAQAEEYANASGPDSGPDAPYKPTVSGQTILGINRTVLIIGGIILAGAAVYAIYRKRTAHG